MKLKYLFNPVLTASCLLLLVSAASAAPKAKPLRTYTFEDCLVVGITDGDTLKARCGKPGVYEKITVRLSGIDTPERKQAYGNRARKALSDFAFGRQADLICNAHDQYQRHVCKVMVAPLSAANGPK